MIESLAALRSSTHKPGVVREPVAAAVTQRETFGVQVGVVDQMVSAGPVERRGHLAARERELLRGRPAEERAVDADRLAIEPGVERLVGRDGIVAAGREREPELDVLGDVGRHAEPRADAVAMALAFDLLVDRLVAVAQIAREPQVRTGGGRHPRLDDARAPARRWPGRPAPESRQPGRGLLEPIEPRRQGRDLGSDRCDFRARRRAARRRLAANARMATSSCRGRVCSALILLQFLRL